MHKLITENNYSALSFWIFIHLFIYVSIPLSYFYPTAVKQLLAANIDYKTC